MKTVKTLLFTLLLASLGFAVSAQSDPHDKVDMHARTEFSKSSVHLFPNPVVEYLTIKFEEPVAKKTSLSLHNILGSSMETEREVIDDFEVRLRVKDLPTGYYLLSLKDEHTNQHGTFKFLKR
jgi:Secretion system C-terminal sorting domain